MKCKPSNPKHKKGLWSPDEDQKLKDYIINHGLGFWNSVPINAGLQRNGKSCRLRWINYLRPGLKRGMFTAEEEHTIMTLHGLLGNKWSQMSQHLPGRSDNEIKNHWHSYLKKKISKLETLKSQSMSLDTILTQESSSLKSKCSGLESSQEAEESSVVPRIPPKILFSDWLTNELSVSGDAISSSKEPNINGESCSSDIQGPELDDEYDFYNLIFEENICPDFSIDDVKMYSL